MSEVGTRNGVGGRALGHAVKLKGTACALLNPSCYSERQGNRAGAKLSISGRRLFVHFSPIEQQRTGRLEQALTHTCSMFGMCASSFSCGVLSGQ